jgi:hypothetical protein
MSPVELHISLTEHCHDCLGSNVPILQSFFIYRKPPIFPLHYESLLPFIDQFVQDQFNGCRAMGNLSENLNTIRLLFDVARKKFMTDPITGKIRVFIGGILPELEAVLSQPFYQMVFPYQKQRPDNAVLSFRFYSRQAPDPGPALKTEEHCFGLIVRRVRGNREIVPVLFPDRRKKSISSLPRPFLDTAVGDLPASDPFQVEGRFGLFRDPPDELFIPVRLAAAKPMVDMSDT